MTRIGTMTARGRDLWQQFAAEKHIVCHGDVYTLDQCNDSTDATPAQLGEFLELAFAQDYECFECFGTYGDVP